MKFAPTTKRPELATSYPEDADKHASLLMKDFDAVDLWLQQNQGQYLENTTQRLKRNIALGVKQGVASGLEEVSYGIRKAVGEVFVQEVVDREVSKELSKGLGLGVQNFLFDQLYKSYEELYAKLGAKYESARSYNLRLHQRLPKRLPRADISPYSSRNVSDKHARQDGEQSLWSDDGLTPSENSEHTSEISEEQNEGSSDRCCMCGTIASQEELTTTMCCSKFVGSICLEEALQETGKCCLCHKAQSHFELNTSVGQSEQELNYKFHFVETQNQAEASGKDKSIIGTNNQSETGVACPSWEASPPSLVPEKSAEPLKCLRETSEWATGTPEARKIEDQTRRITESFSSPCSEPSKISHKDSSTHKGVQRPHPLKNDPGKSSITKEYEIVLRLFDPAVISYLKDLNREDVLANVSEALEERLCPSVHTTIIFEVLLLESGDIQLKYEVDEGRAPDLEGGAASLAEHLENFVRGRLRKYTVTMHNVETETMDLSDEFHRIRVIEELVGSNASAMQSLSRPDDVSFIRWTMKRKNLQTTKIGSITVGLATATQANEVIARGLVWKGVRRYCVKQGPKQNLVQCDRCQAFGHIAWECSSLLRCEMCARVHRTQDCPLGLSIDPKDLKCALCGGRHSAREYNCTVKRCEEMRLQLENRFSPTYADRLPAVSATTEEHSSPLLPSDTTIPLPVIPSSQMWNTQLYSKVGDKTPIVKQRAPFAAFGKEINLQRPDGSKYAVPARIVNMNKFSTPPVQPLNRTEQCTKISWSTEQQSYPIEDLSLRAGRLADFAAQQACSAKALNHFDPVWQFDPPLKPIGIKPVVNLPKLPSHNVSGPKCQSWSEGEWKNYCARAPSDSKNMW